MANSKKPDHKKILNSIPEKNFRGMIESTAGIPWVVDMDTFQFTYVGPQAEKILGYPADTWYKTDFWPEHIHPDDREGSLDFCIEASQKGEDYNFEYRMIHRDGHSVWILDYVNVVIEDGKPVRLQGFMFDVSQRKRTEESIKNIAAGVSAQSGEAFYQQMVKHLAKLFDADYAFIGLLDENNPNTINTRCVFAHGAAAENISYSLTNTPCNEVIDARTCCHPKGVQQLFPNDQLLVDMGIESFIGTPLFDSNNKPIGLIEVLDSKPMPENPQLTEILEIFAARASAEIERDKTHQQLTTHHDRLEELVAQRTTELTNINQELESFSYSVSHDLRAPLRHIDGFSQILEEDYTTQLDAEGQQLLKRIRNGAQHMGQLIDNLLLLSRVSRGQVKREPLKLSSMAQDIFNKLQHYDATRKISFSIQPDLCAHADHQLMHVLLENLIGNAWKYTAKTSDARIYFEATNDKNGETIFCLRDNGAGFDIKHADKLFTAFKRLHSNKDFEGTGIGLATVQRIINRHAGRVWAEAEKEKGARFYFTLS